MREFHQKAELCKCKCVEDVCCRGVHDEDGGTGAGGECVCGGGVHARGEITVFLALLGITVCGFIYVIIIGTRNTYARLRTEVMADAAIESAFSEYSAELFNKYGLLYVDTYYNGTADGKDETFLSHYTGYFEVNSSSMSDISFLSSDVSDIEHASDNGYESVRHQIRGLMEGKGVPEYLSDEEVLEEYIRDNEVLYEKFMEYEYTECDYETYLRDYVSYEDKFSMVIEFIEEDMREEVYGGFDFDNLICAAEVTVYVEFPSGNVYEYTTSSSYYGEDAP